MFFKKFLSIFILVTLLILGVTNVIAQSKEYKKVALVSVSTQYNPLEVPKVEKTLKSMGYNVTDKYLNENVSDLGYVNIDEVRAYDLISAMLDDSVDVIWFLKGGNGAFNLIPYLYNNIDQLKKSEPKILVGFSDITAIHQFVNNFLNWQSIHGVLAGINSIIHRTDIDKPMNIEEPILDVDEIWNNGLQYNNLLPLNKKAKKGLYGTVEGGNFSIFSLFFGTKYKPDYSGKILVLEDVGLSYRQLDRMLHQLLFLKDNKGDNYSGIVFGQFYPLDPTDYESLMYKTVLKRFAERIDKPVYYFPYFGHGEVNKPLILGASATILCNDSPYCTFKQDKHG